MTPSCISMARLVLAAALWRAFSEAIISVGSESLPSSVKCPSNCQEIFLKMQNGIQEVKMDLLAEPKTGSSTAGEWAWGALVGTCLHLQRLYGEKSCSFQHGRSRQELSNVTFEPALSSQETAPCSCASVERVHYVVDFRDTVDKHRLPVDINCTYRHHFGIVSDPDDPACLPKTGQPLENMGDLWQCVKDAGCTFPNPEVLHVAPMRDPRAVTISSYFYRLKHLKSFVAKHPEWFASVDTFFQSHLGAICRWSSLRYLFFTEILSASSEVFWFEETFADPVDFHGRFLSFAGLNLPLETLVDMARVANSGTNPYGFRVKGPDAHIGGIKHDWNSSFRDELNGTSLAMMDDVMRTWLPPVLLRRFGIRP